MAKKWQMMVCQFFPANCVQPLHCVVSESQVLCNNIEHKEYGRTGFQIRCLKKILGIKWQDPTPHTDTLARAGIPLIFSLLSQRRLRWLAYVKRMNESRLPKYLLYGQLAIGSRRTGSPTLRFKDVCKRDMKSCNITHDNWEEAAKDRSTWRREVWQGIKRADETRSQQAATKSFCPTILQQPPVPKKATLACLRIRF